VLWVTGCVCWQEPQGELAASFVNWNKNVLTLALNNVRTTSAVAEDGSTPPTATEVMNTLSVSFLDQYIQAVQTYGDDVLSPAFTFPRRALLEEQLP